MLIQKYIVAKVLGIYPEKITNIAKIRIHKENRMVDCL
jgi:hypothetical protein